MNLKSVSIFFAFIYSFNTAATVFACGGLFGEPGPQAVNQAAEKIIFVKHDDGFMTAAIQIQYEGEASEFGWIIPVPGTPEITVSSNLAFARLQSATNPSFQLTTTVEGDCAESSFLGGANDSTGANNRSASDSKVIISAAGNVGPYDYVLLDIPTPSPNGAQAALTWLETNGYRTSSGSEELFQSYLDQGMNLLAFRLSKNADTGDIRPVVMKYKSERPMIPIQLASVAVQDDMGVLVWVLGSERATPVNYKTLEINDTLLDWFNFSNYNDLIIRAANEAGGQGFVAEMVAETDQLEGVIFTEFENSEWLRITSTSYEEGSDLLRDIERFLLDLNSNCSDNCQINDVNGVGVALENAFPQTTRETRDKLAECLSCNAHLVEGFDHTKLKNSFDDWVVSSIRETQELIDGQRYFSRFYTTMSASEMTLDPVFDFNPNLANISNQKSASRIIECDGSTSRSDAPWRTTLPSGLVVRGVGSRWPIQTDDPDLAANIIVSQGSTTDERVVRDNIASIRKSLDLRNADIVSPGGCGCSSTRGNDLPLALLFGIFLFARRKRKRSN